MSTQIVAKNEKPQAKFLAQVLNAQREERGVLPYFLGLKPQALAEFVEQNQLSDSLQGLLNVDKHSVAWERGEMRQQLLDMREQEWDDIRVLLLEHRARKHELEEAFAHIVAAACLGGDHLWRDLGLGNRTQLSDLLFLFFPDLAGKNTKDMKWKRFFYKQLCEQEGGYVCRAPTCEECKSYEECFGDEN